jgi:hypothetical protein
MKITNLITAPLLRAAATPKNNLIGATDTEIEISLTLRHKLPEGGRIMVMFDKFNPRDLDQNALSHFSSAPTCTGLQNVPTTIQCEYDRDRDTVILLDLEGKPPKSELIFKVNRFRNPGDSRPRKTINIFT